MLLRTVPSRPRAGTKFVKQNIDSMSLSSYIYLHTKASLRKGGMQVGKLWHFYNWGLPRWLLNEVRKLNVCCP